MCGLVRVLCVFSHHKSSEQKTFDTSDFQQGILSVSTCPNGSEINIIPTSSHVSLGFDQSLLSRMDQTHA